VRRVVMFSGGIGSWAAAKRVAERYGTDDLTLLFTDTLMEDEDLYRFLIEAAHSVLGHPAGVDESSIVDMCEVVRRDLRPIEVSGSLPARKGVLTWLREEATRCIPGLVWLAEGRTPWEVFHGEKILSGRLDPCSKILKRQVADRWREANCDRGDSVHYIGVDWTEIHRYERLRDRQAVDGWVWEAPLCEPPYVTRDEVFGWLRAEGIEQQRLYRMGFSHNNCGGFCIKAGKGHFATLLREMPERYAFHEQRERELRTLLGPGAYFLREGPEGMRTAVTLTELRERIEAGQQCDLFDIGGCGCFVDTEDEAVVARPEEEKP
jgi:hypothetical protein